MKMLKNRHTVNYYKTQQDDTLQLFLRLRGGCKRGAARAFKEEKVQVSKDEKIDAKKAELNVLLIQLNDFANAATIPMINHIRQALIQGDHVIDATLEHMSTQTLRKLQLHWNTTHSEQGRIDFLAKFTFMKDFADIEE